MSSKYGALEAATAMPAEPRTPNKGVWVAVAGLFAVACVCALGVASVGSHAPAAVTDANRDRAVLAPVSPAVAEMTAKVLDLSNGIRWAIFGFGKDSKEIVPLMKGAATNNWKKDFKVFADALPEDEIAAAVYNFEYWTGDDTYALDPLLITWAPQSTNAREQSEAGYYLGAVIVATDHPDENQQLEIVALESISETYEDFCENERGEPAEFCMGSFHNCPFAPKGASEGEMAAGNPCKKEVCEGAVYVDSESVAGEAPDAIPGACCDYIEQEYCTDESLMGCHPVAMENIMALCDNKPVDPIPDCLLPPEECDGQQCLDSCKQPCSLMDGGESQTYVNCSGCAPPTGEEGRGMANKCYPGALGYQDMRCCGAADECELQDAQNSDSCDALERLGCAFMLHAECADYVTLQEEEAAGESEEEEALGE